MKTISSTLIKLKIILSGTVDDKDDSASKSFSLAGSEPYVDSKKSKKINK